MKSNDIEFTLDGKRAVVSILGRETGKQGAVTVLDLKTGKSTEPAPVGKLPGYIALTRDGTQVLVCHPAGDFITVIDTDTLAVITTIKTDLGLCAEAIGMV